MKLITEVNIYTSAAPTWDLELEGAISDTISKSEFENGIACHGAATWVDGNETWSGLPLWLLVGWVDDDNSHGPDAFNDTLAALGYDVTVEATDGWSKTFASADVALNNNMIIANELNGAPLPPDMYPLRLVGPGLTGGQKVSLICRIYLSNMPWDLTLTGASTYLMPRAEFETKAAANPLSYADGDGTWEGMALWRLVAEVDDGDPATFNDALAADGYDIKIIASDGYSRTFASADIALNDNYTVADVLNGDPLPSDQYPLKHVGANVTGGNRVGMIVEIELVGLPAGDSSSSLTVTANVVPPMIGIALDRDEIDYGNIGPGESSAVETVKVINIGSVVVDVTVEALGSDVEAQDFYEQSLYIDALLYDPTTVIATILTETDQDVDTQLNVPITWNNHGSQEATLIFWASDAS